MKKTPLNTLQAQLQAEKDKLDLILEAVADGVILADLDGRIELMNGAAERLTGWTARGSLGKPLFEIFDVMPGETSQQGGSALERAWLAEVRREQGRRLLLTCSDGSQRLVACQRLPRHSAQGLLAGSLVVFSDETSQWEQNARIEYLSYRDGLTGLFNRAFFEAITRRMDDPAHLPLSMIMGDLDGLRMINDAFGIEAGDLALIKTSEALREICGQKALVFRWSGDDFLILLPNTDAEARDAMNTRIKEAVSDLTVFDMNMSMSTGCGTKEGAGQSWKDIYKTAEEDMNTSKFLDAKSYRNVILTSIRNTLHEKSYETEEHGERMGQFCRAIGRRLGLTAVELDEMEIFAVLHDIGKIGIESDILNKPAALNQAEWEEIQRHPEIGYRIASTVPELVNIAEYILCHHERWDGKGYPRGLPGSQIPQASLILSVVDAFDAMTQDRPYRRAMSCKEAKAELVRNAGSQFDPQVVRVFIDHLAAG